MIETSAFRECKNLEYISLNYSEIDNEFSYITSLKKVEFGDSVTSIKEMAFWGCTGIESITFGRGLTKIKRDAFWDCVNLKTIVNFSNLYLQLGSNMNMTINAPNGFFDGDFIFGDVEGIKTLCGYIGSDTIIVLPENCKGENYVIKELLFADNYNIASVTIPNSVTNIGDRAFWACDRLKNVTIGNGVTNIGESAFYNCSSLTNVTIGNSVTSIGEYAFDGCSGLTSVTIPNSVTSIERGAFDGCIGLISITVEENNSVYDSRNNCNAIIETATNTLVKGCNTTNIPNGITSIEEYAFLNCTGLTNVTIPNSVTSIGMGAFNYCTGLTSITVEENNSVYDSRNNCNAIIETATNTLVKGCNTTVIPNGVTSIEKYALSGCSSLTSVTIPNGVTSIGHGAFSDCSSLTSVTIGNSVTNIGMAAFTDCHSLKSVYLLSETPPAINYSFIGIYEKTTVHVPNGALAAYKAVEEWNYFANIVEFDPTGIEATEEDAPAFEVTSNGIKFTASEGKAIAVYTIGGALIESTDSYAGEEITLEKGVYVVKIGNKIIKVKL